MMTTSDKKINAVSSSLCEEPVVKHTEIENKMGEEGNGSSDLMGTEYQDCKMKPFWSGQW